MLAVRRRQGYAFSPDTVWQREFEDAFPYEETPDQLKAIEEIKQDMERPHPMDRLLCGDVGYGKTEVAIRAAFKAVMDSKQVAVLVPTTILAEQHYNTFVQRLARIIQWKWKCCPVFVGAKSNGRLSKSCAGEKSILLSVPTGYYLRISNFLTSA
jgi:RecG-like helicase